MTIVRIVCDKCGFVMEKPAASLPQRRVKATCPKCQNVFSFDPLDVIHRFSPPTEPAFQVTQKNHISLLGRADAGTNKALFIVFLALVLVTVGVRLWANQQALDAPYPTLLAASRNKVAVIGGRSIYLFATDGSLLRSYSIPKGVWPTQLFWDRGVLSLADLRSKKVYTFGEGSPGAYTFTGTTFSSHFKVAREPATGRFFVTDSHRVAVFDENRIFLRSFGKEGTGSGDFKFPNGLVFDEAGQLLIANTKRPSVDRYTPDGHFQGTVVTPTSDKCRYPTNVVVTPDRLFLLERDGSYDLGKVRIYDRSGKKVGDLPLGDFDNVGDLAADGDRLFVTDRDHRQFLAFSLPDLRPLGSFSREFEQLCARWTEDEAFFNRISSGALIVLLVLCAPVIFFFVRFKKAEVQKVSKIDLDSVSSSSATARGDTNHADIVLGTPVNRSLQRTSYILLGSSIFLFLLLAVIAQVNLPVSLMLAAMLSGMLAFLGGVICLMKAGGIGDFKRRQTESTFKRIISEGKLPLTPGEQVERVALAQRSSAAQDIVLLVFTNVRLLTYALNWNRVAKIEQIPYESFVSVQAPSGRMLEVVQKIQVTIQAVGETRRLSYYYPLTDFLKQLGEEFSRRLGRISRVPHADLCLTCFKPLQGDICATCVTRLTPDRRAMWLSVLFPGLGQLRNGEMQKGLVFLFFAVALLMFSYIGVRGWFFEGADLTIKDKYNIGAMIVMVPVLYISNIVDAYRSSIRGRKPE